MREGGYFVKRKRCLIRCLILVQGLYTLDIPDNGPDGLSQRFVPSFHRKNIDTNIHEYTNIYIYTNIRTNIFGVNVRGEVQSVFQIWTYGYVADERTPAVPTPCILVSSADCTILCHQGGQNGLLICITAWEWGL
jgi:hypothetical protein